MDIIVITGAPGIGKSALLPLVSEALPDKNAWLDGDSVGRTKPNARTRKRLDLIQQGAGAFSSSPLTVLFRDGYQELVRGQKKSEAEVRKALPDRKTNFLRPLPGRARMYPETDLPLLKIHRDFINEVKKDLPRLRDEIEGELDSAYDWVKKSYDKSHSQSAYQYMQQIKQRINDQYTLQKQMK